jgi:hypothetical protein
MPLSWLPYSNSAKQVFGIAFSIIGLLPSIASVLFYSLPNGGGPAMVWGVRSRPMITLEPNLMPIIVARCQCVHHMCRNGHG